MGNDALDLDYEPLERVLRVLDRSAIGEFSGCLLYADVHKKLSDPTLGAIYKCMSPTRRGTRRFSISSCGRWDAASISRTCRISRACRTCIPNGFSSRVSIRTGRFYRYQNISDHLKRNPQYRFHPIFRYFDNWCKDERRHSRFFALMLRSQPDFMRGPRNRFAIKFFTLAVYITMYLRDSESAVYARLGIDWEKFDVKVINERACRTRSVGFGNPDRLPVLLSCLRRMARNNGANKRRAFGQRPRARRRVVMRYARYANNVLQYAKLMAQPHDQVEVLPRSPGPRRVRCRRRASIELAGAPRSSWVSAPSSRPTPALPKP